MNGFIDIVNGFSQSAIDALVTVADDLYGSGGTGEETGDSYTQVSASSWVEISTAVSNATTDTRINVADGTYGMDGNTLDGNGTNKIIIKATNPHLAIFTDRVVIYSDLLTFRQCKFTGAGTEGILVMGNDVQFWRNIFDDYTRGAESNSSWFRLNDNSDAGTPNTLRTTLAYNNFINKDSTSERKLLTCNGSSLYSEPLGHHIHHNYFNNIQANAGSNVGECMLFYDREEASSDFSYESGIIVEYNYGIDALGDGRFIDLKFSNGLIRNNTLEGESGTVTLRQGFSSIAEYNVLNYSDLSISRFIQVNGADHIVRYNYVRANNPGTHYTGGFYLKNGVSGDYTGQQVTNLTLQGNILDSCHIGIEVGRGANDLNIQGTFSDNKMINCTKGTQEGDRPPTITWDNNRYTPSGSGGDFQADMIYDNTITADIPASWGIDAVDTGIDA